MSHAAELLEDMRSARRRMWIYFLGLLVLLVKLVWSGDMAALGFGIVYAAFAYGALADAFNCRAELEGMPS